MATIFCEYCDEVHSVKDVDIISVEETPEFRTQKQVLTFYCSKAAKQGICSVRGKI